MKIAIAIDTLRKDAQVPEYLEAAAGFLIVDEETEETSMAKGVRTEIILSAGCDALLCGNIKNDAVFKEITEHGIVKFYAAGMQANKAIAAMKRYELPLLTEKRRKAISNPRLSIRNPARR